MARRDTKPNSQRVSDQLDARLAAAAIAKTRSGQTPTTQERAALKRVERQQEERKRWEFYRSIPQKHWREMSGRQAKVINEQAQRYGIPFDGKSVDLSAVVKALHQFLAANAVRLARDDHDAVPTARTAGERLALVRARREEVKLELELGRLVRIDAIRPALAHATQRLRQACELIQRQGDDASFEILDEAILEIDDTFQRMTSENDRDPGQADTVEAE